MLYHVGFIMAQACMDLILKLSSPDTFTSGSIPKRIALVLVFVITMKIKIYSKVKATYCLDHKTFDDTMENHIIIVAVTAVNTKILHCARTVFTEQSDVNIAIIRAYNCTLSKYRRSWHKTTSFWWWKNNMKY